MNYSRIEKTLSCLPGEDAVGSSEQHRMVEKQKEFGGNATHIKITLVRLKPDILVKI